MNISIVGLGYVGLPLAKAFSKKYQVIGFDIKKEKIDKLKKENFETNLISKEANIYYTNNEIDLKKSDFIIIAVPTPVNTYKKPDFSYIKKASKIVARNMKDGTIIIYESTVYPGATEEICIPILEKYSNKVCKKDFFVGYSPERINVGDKEHTLENIVKVVSATDENTLKKISNLYKSIIKAGVKEVSSIKVAEAAKIIENTQRDINIAFMNEMSMLLNKLDIDVAEVIDACNTKWNFAKYKPGLVGGHCIGVDPYYLIEKAKKENFNAIITKTTRKINENMTTKLVENIENELKKINKDLSKTTVAVLGVTFKPDVTDIRNSKSIEVIKLLIKKGVNVIVSDPKVYLEKYNMKKIEEIKNADIIVFAVGHDEYKRIILQDIKSMLKNNRKIVYDVDNIFNKEELERIGLLKQWI